MAGQSGTECGRVRGAPVKPAKRILPEQWGPFLGSAMFYGRIATQPLLLTPPRGLRFRSGAASSSRG